MKVNLPPTYEPLLLEIGVEEIPARFLPGAIHDLRETASQILTENHFTTDENPIFDESLRTFATPRRLALIIDKLDERQSSYPLNVFGPPKHAAVDADGNYTKAALGFAKKQGVGPESLSFVKTDKGEYLKAVYNRGGGKTRDLLPEILKEIVLGLAFPKSMRWGDGTLRFVRPIQWITAVYGEEAVLFEVDGIKSGNRTYGHRFLSPGEVVIKDIGDYPRLLEENFVVLDKEVREKRIWEQAERLARGVGGAPVRDDELLSIVACLVEYPVCVLGGFSEEYLMLPDELLTAVMKGHQKYLSVKGPDGKLKNSFVVVSNTKEENAETVRVGAERVIRARFEDARFYFEEDRKKALSERVDELKRVTYHEKLGSLFDKTTRLKEIAEALAARLCPDRAEACARAAYLSKADLITGVVREFPELQGVMGKYYALGDGEALEVAEAIREQYLPAFSGDIIPQSDVGAVLSMADRVDGIAAFFSIGLKPTGSEDPFALRRHAISAIAILEGRGYGLAVDDLIAAGLSALKGVPGAEAAGPEIRNFFQQRLEQILLSRGHAFDLVQSVLSVSTAVPLADLFARAEALGAFKSHPGYNAFLTAVKRVRNITPDAELPPLDEGLFQHDTERALKAAVVSARAEAAALMGKRGYTEALDRLTTLTGPINFFFDHVLVMDKDERTRQNRLALLKDAWSLAASMADFSRLREVEEAPQP